MKSDNITNLAKYLVLAQADIKFAAKDATNPHYRSKYADLPAIIDAIKPSLNKNGISFLQLINFIDNQTVVDTMLLHVSGEFITSRTPVVVAKPNDPQSLGSAITYAKRYGLQAIIGVPADVDDDGNLASGINGEAAMGRGASKPAVNTSKPQQNFTKKTTNDFGDF